MKKNASLTTSCSASTSQQRDRSLDADNDASIHPHGANADGPQHDMFGDWNLNALMMFMLLLHFMQYAMRQPCGC
ncbi:unnamed protein product [Hyaloperonospora brassicae]|uniref:RxLR effector candidate protein n=1 Tax=Hyaloperonospora brassicae TaxID=162125 RepID=A0AAV0T5F2_HYABA|nr:unnamed protein product [Hyaloperonospora brassicae]